MQCNEPHNSKSKKQCVFMQLVGNRPSFCECISYSLAHSKCDRAYPSQACSGYSKYKFVETPFKQGELKSCCPQTPEQQAFRNRNCLFEILTLTIISTLLCECLSITDSIHISGFTCNTNVMLVQKNNNRLRSPLRSSRTTTLPRKKRTETSKLLCGVLA